MLPEEYSMLFHFLQNYKYPEEANGMQTVMIKQKAPFFTIDENELHYVHNGKKKKVISNKEEQLQHFYDCHKKNEEHLSVSQTIKQLYSKFYWKDVFNSVSQLCNMCCGSPDNQLSSCWNMVEVSTYSLKSSNEISSSNVILKVIDLSTNFTVLRICNSKSVSEICSTISNIFWTFGWPKIIHLSAIDGNLPDIIASLQENLMLSHKFGLTNTLNSTCDVEFPEISIRYYKISYCKGIEDILAKSRESDELKRNICFLTRSSNSFASKDVSTWQDLQLLELVGCYPQKWRSLLPSLMFKMNHAVVESQHGLPFTAMFSRPSYWKRLVPPVKISSKTCDTHEMTENKKRKGTNSESGPDNASSECNATAGVAEAENVKNATANNANSSTPSSKLTEVKQKRKYAKRKSKKDAETEKLTDEIHVMVVADSSEEKYSPLDEQSTPTRSAESRQKLAKKLPSQNFKCQVCDVENKDKKSFLIHLKQHKDCTLVCKDCDNFKTKSAIAFYRHRRTHFGYESYKCDWCSKTFPISSLLRAHERMHISEEPLVCEYCGQFLKNEESLKRHIARSHHTSPCPCDLCDYVGKHPADVTSHKLRKHFRKFKCDKCNFTSNMKSGIDKHMRVVHDFENRPHACKQCKYRSKDLRTLTEHVRFQHNPNIVRFECTKCDNKFKTLTMLRDHMPVHTGQLLYGCKLCGYRTKYRQTVRTHCQVKHKGHSLQGLLDSPGPESLKEIRNMISESNKIKNQSIESSDEGEETGDVMTCEVVIAENERQFLLNQSDVSK